MKLKKSEIENFFKLNKSLLFYVNKEKQLIKGISSVAELRGQISEKVVKLRQMIVKDPACIDTFLKENPFNFSHEELQTIESWKKGILDTFLVVKYEKETTIFYHPKTQKCYGVLSLYDPLPQMLGPYLPIYAETWLIPFKGRIIYDGLIAPYNIMFGRGMEKSIQAEYQEAILKHGIVTSLTSQETKTTTDEELLKFYLKSEGNRDKFWEEIEKLQRKSHQLEAVYHQEQGRYFSRGLKKKLKEIGVTGYFAVIDDVIVASAPSNKELDKQIVKILPKEKNKWVFQFKI